MGNLTLALHVGPVHGYRPSVRSQGYVLIHIGLADHSHFVPFAIEPGGLRKGDRAAACLSNQQTVVGDGKYGSSDEF